MSGVNSREPLLAAQPPQDAQVNALFLSDSRIYRFVDLLATAGVERGLIGPREAPRLWDRHVFNCAAVVPALPLHAQVADIGSGAGLPGIVLALARPDLRVTLVEPLLRRTTFLDETVRELGLGNVRVVRSRAEDVRDTFGVVVSRAVAPLSKLVGWCLPLTQPAGLVLALKGQTADAELAECWPELRRRGVTVARVEEYAVASGSPTRVVRIESP